MPRLRDTSEQVQRLREDVDSMRCALELAGLIEPKDDKPEVAAGDTKDPDPDGAATDSAGEPVTGAGGDGVGSDSPPPDQQTAENYPGFHAAALRETRNPPATKTPAAKTAAPAAKKSPRAKGR